MTTVFSAVKSMIGMTSQDVNNKRMKIKAFAGVPILALLIVSCKNNSSSESTTNVDSDDICEYTEDIVDSIGGKSVGHDCAVAYSIIDDIQWKWMNVKSPSMLARARASWKDDIATINNECHDIDGEDRQILDSIYQVIKNTRDEKIKKFSVPDISVIENLENCISKVERMKRKEDMKQFMEVRHAMINELDIIHLCVEPKSNQIGEVKRLAQSLKEKQKEKCKELGL